MVAESSSKGTSSEPKNVGANYWNGDGVEKDDSWAAFGMKWQVSKVMHRLSSLPDGSI